MNSALLLIVSGLLGAAQALAGDGPALEATGPAGLAFRLAGQERQQDGGLVFTYDLLPPAAGPLRDLEAVYGGGRRQGRGASGHFDHPTEFYRLPVSPGRPVSISSGRSELLDIRARARQGSTWYYAQTLANAFGRSKRPETGAERLASAPDWPGFQLIGGEKFYRAQTGQPITLRLAERPAGRPARVTVVESFEGKISAWALPVNAEGLYRHTPAHEANLAKSGYGGQKDVWFVADLPDQQAVISFYLPVYRAFYGQTSPGGGLAVLLAAALATLLWVRRWNRAFPWR